MANQRDRLDAMLDLVEANARMVINAADERPEAPQRNEVWWPFLIQRFGDEDTLFRRIRLDRRVFDLAYVFVQEVPLEQMGKKGAVRSNRERLLFLTVFMAKGIDVLEDLVLRFIRTRSHIIERVEAIARLFRPHLVNGAVRFMDESHPDVPGSVLVVDCTVVQIRRPKQDFHDAKIFFSGKHGIYALKKEVCVNVRCGTAALVSPSFPGSVHDIPILRPHARQLREILGERTLLADLGY